MPERTQLLAATDPEWDAWLQAVPHDFHHLAAYHRFSERMGEGRAAMVVHGTPDRFIAWPYLIRGIDNARRDATSVYGYSGPVGRGLEDEEFRARAWSACREIWARQGLVALFTRFHPLLENARACQGLTGATATPGGEIMPLGRTVSIDLSDGREARWARYQSKLRQDMHWAERRGLTVEHDPDWRHFDDFVNVYLQTMRRNEASERYLFSRAYLDALRRALDGILHLAVAKVDGAVVAAMLFTVYRGLASAHLAGTADHGHGKLSPQKNLYDGVADISSALGAATLHMGAGRGGHEDALFEFKSRFSPLRHAFLTGRWILDGQVYGELTRQIPPSAAGAFFPAYRAPMPAIQDRAT